MPHQSGVTRMWVDRRRDRATDPARDRRDAVPGRCLCSCQGAGARSGGPGCARPEGVEPPVVGVGDRDVAVTRAQVGRRAHDVVRAGVREQGAGGLRRERCVLPALVGIADGGGIPTLRPLLVSEKWAGLTRVRAEARRGLLPEQRFGGEHACHRRDILPEQDAHVNGFSSARRRRSTPSTVRRGRTNDRGLRVRGDLHRERPRSDRPVSALMPALDDRHLTAPGFTCAGKPRGVSRR